MWEHLPTLQSELNEFENRMRAGFEGRGHRAYLDSLSLHLVEGGGKRLRPAMTIAGAMLDNYNREKALNIAIGLEMLHTATLVHDDIIDDSTLRRGRPTVSAQKGVNTAVFTGDYLFAKSILMLSSAGLPIEKLNVAAKAIEEVCIGEVAQFLGRGKVPGFKSYLSRITRKTAMLFATAAALGAHCAGIDESLVQAAGRFGLYFGIAFQINDDILDISGSQKSAGKPILTDLKEGVITLPLLLAAVADSSFRTRIESLYLDKTVRSFSVLAQVAKDAVILGGISAADDIRSRYLQKASKMLSRLPQSEGKYLLGEILKTQM